MIYVLPGAHNCCQLQHRLGLWKVGNPTSLGLPLGTCCGRAYTWQSFVSLFARGRQLSHSTDRIFKLESSSRWAGLSSLKSGSGSKQPSRWANSRTKPCITNLTSSNCRHYRVVPALQLPELRFQRPTRNPPNGRSEWMTNKQTTVYLACACANRGIMMQ